MIYMIGIYLLLKYLSIWYTIKRFPFHSDINWRIKNKDGEYWRIDTNDYVCDVNELRIYGTTTSVGWILPCSYHLIQDSEYEKKYIRK